MEPSNEPLNIMEPETSSNSASTPPVTSSYNPPKPAKLSLGCSAFGGVFVPMSDDKCVEILRSAFKAGINLLDTAPWYKSSEAVVGRCLRRLAEEDGLQRSSYVLNTKCGRYTTGQMFDFSKERVTKSVLESLQKLQTPYIDTIQIHDCEFGDEDVIVNETLPALAELRRQGKVRRIGVTSYEISTLRRILERTQVPVDAALVYCRYSLNDRSLLETAGDGNFLDFLSKRKMSFIYASPIAMGLLCNRAPPVWHPASDALKARTIAANKYAEERGFNLARLAIGFVLRQEQIPTTLVSCTSLELMDANVEVMQKGLAPEENAVLDEILEKFYPTSEHWEGVEKAAMKAKAERKAREAFLKQQQQAELNSEDQASEFVTSVAEEKGAVQEAKVE